MQFKKIPGLEEVKMRLREAVNSGRIAHAQLFGGPEGNAGIALALAYTSYLFCKNRTSEDSCGECPSCQKIAIHSHPDVHFSYPIMLSKTNKVATSTDVLPVWRTALQENMYLSINQWYKLQGEDNKQGIIGTEESQHILKKLTLKSFEGDYKVLLMWLPEMMNTTAANKLLKVIEEPPEKTLFILISAHPEELLPTIISRTQLLKVRKFTDDEIITELKNRGTEGNAQETASLSDGSMAKAIELSGDDTQTNQFFQLFVDWMRICFKRDVPASMSWVEELTALGKETQKAYLIYSLEMLRKSLLANVSSGAMLKAPKAQYDFLSKFSPHISLNDLPVISGHLNEAHYHLERNANPKILLLDLTLKMFATFKKAGK